MEEQKDMGATVLSPGAERLVEAAAGKQRESNHEQLGVYHWLLALLERHGPMAESLAVGIEADSLRQSLGEELLQGNTSDPLDRETVITRARERSRRRGKSQVVETDLASVILVAAGYRLAEEEADPSAYARTGTSPSMPKPAQGGAASPAYRPRPKLLTPTLDEFGRDLTRASLEGKLNLFVGREEETQLVIETLCRDSKPNPLLVGPAGVGKTAIVEGLAHRIVRGQVPDLLKGSRLVSVQPSTLVAGASMLGELEKRMKAIISEASQDGILLFIDEVHSIMGAGGREGTSDIASQLKPVLARGDLACIAATTDDEHRRFIETDAALERRFQPIRVQELNARQTFAILAALRDKYQRTRDIEIADHVLNWLIDFSQDFLRNRYFPDKAVDLLEQCVAYATAHAKKQVDLANAQTVAQRIVGMPIALNERLGALRQGLRDKALMGEDDVETLVNRLAITMRGLDLRASRPNAVVLLLGDAAPNSEALAQTIAVSLFGSAERVVTIDFSRFTQPHDVTMLIGAPPGYIGYSDSLPLHKVVQMPWCVLRCENVHACHPAVREVLTQALDEGFLTDARGKRIFLSDVVALLSADIAGQSRRAPGFRRSAEVDPQSGREAAEAEMGRALVEQVDIVCAEVKSSEDAERNWLEQHLLAGVQERYNKQGMDVRWDESLLEWLLKQKGASGSRRDWERLVDERLSPLLVERLPESREGPVRSLVVYWDGSRIKVEEVTDEERSE